MRQDVGLKCYGSCRGILNASARRCKGGEAIGLDMKVEIHFKKFLVSAGAVEIVEGVYDPWFPQDTCNHPSTCAYIRLHTFYRDIRH